MDKAYKGAVYKNYYLVFVILCASQANKIPLPSLSKDSLRAPVALCENKVAL